MSNEQIIQFALAGIPVSILFALMRRETARELVARVILVVIVDLFILGLILIAQRMM